jgi:MaoC like domain
VGSDAGFGGVILHGLSTFGFAARAILKAVGGGVPSVLRYFGVRFTAPVMPGDGLVTSIWEMKKAPDGTTEVAFEVKNTRTGKVCLSVDVFFSLTDFFYIYRLFLVVGSRKWSSPSSPSSENTDRLQDLISFCHSEYNRAHMIKLLYNLCKYVGSPRAQALRMSNKRFTCTNHFPMMKREVYMGNRIQDNYTQLNL